MTDMNTCPNCGNQVAAGARFCGRCGLSLARAAAGNADGDPLGGEASRSVGGQSPALSGPIDVEATRYLGPGAAPVPPVPSWAAPSGPFQASPEDNRHTGPISTVGAPPPGVGREDRPPTAPRQGPAAGAGRKRLPILIAAGVVLIVVVAVGAFLLMHKSTSGGSTATNQDGPVFGAAPKAGATVNVDDLFDVPPSGDANLNVLYASDRIFVVEGMAQAGGVNATSSSGSDGSGSSEAVIAAIDNNSGKVLWHVSGTDLDPAGKADFTDGSFACSVPDDASRVVCGIAGYSAPSTPVADSSATGSTSQAQNNYVELSSVNMASGKVTTAEADGSTMRYSLNLVGSDALLYSYGGGSDGGGTVVRVDPSTGKTKWTAPITYHADDFPGGHYDGTYVDVPEAVSSGDYSTALLNPDTGARVRTLKGSGYRLNGTYFTTYVAGGGSGSTVNYGSVKTDDQGKVVWQNANVELSGYFGSTGYGTADPLLATNANGYVGVSQTDGKVVWTAPRSLTTDNSLVAVSGGEAFLQSSDSRVRLLHLADGTQTGLVTGSFVAASGPAFYTSSAGRLFAWSTKDGSSLWRADLSDLAPAIDANAARISVENGSMFVADKQSITRLMPSS